MKTIEVTIVTADAPNKNRRVYPMSTCLSLVEQGNKKKKWIGTMNRQIGKPVDLGEKISMGIDLANASHHVSNFRMEENELKATVTVLDTPAGQVLNNMLDAEIDMAFRVFGVVKLRLCEQTNIRMIVDQCKLIEVVAMPAELAA